LHGRFNGSKAPYPPPLLIGACQQDGVTALLMEHEYQRNARWRSEQAWKAVDEICKAFASVSQEEIERIVEQASGKCDRSGKPPQRRFKGILRY
jgi:hypothetical protein